MSFAGSVLFFRTPGGEELAIMPRAEFERLMALVVERMPYPEAPDSEDAEDARHHERAMAEYRAGRAEALTDEAMGQLLAAPTPLAFWRRRRGLTQQQLASAAGIPQGYLSALEAGKKRGTPETLKRIAEALGVTLDQLVA
jgi:DNA-binding XRE family transcriptional regulator